MLADIQSSVREYGTGQKVFILMHGAGAGSESSFMRQLAESLTCESWVIVTFDFAYMVSMKNMGKRRPPDRLAILHQTIEQILSRYANRSIVLAGKSMGGRLASLYNQDPRISAWLAYGYPFIPPTAKTDSYLKRLTHLPHGQTPGLVFQGDRDAFAPKQLPELAQQQGWFDALELRWVAGCDHDFKPLKSTGFTQLQMIEQLAQQTHKWLESLKEI